MWTRGERGSKYTKTLWTSFKYGPFSLSLLDLILLTSPGFSMDGFFTRVGFSMVGLSFCSLSLLELELLLLEGFNFSLTFPIRPDEKVSFDILF